MDKKLLRELRNKSLSIESFREKSTQLCRFIAEKSTVSTTPILVPVIRAGIAMLSPFLESYPGSLVGFVGIKRNEKSFVPKLYYLNLPVIKPNDPIFLLDPMLATGGSICLAIEQLIKNGASEKNIQIFSVLSNDVAQKKIHSSYTKVKIHFVEKDPGLDSHKKISPGLGDFGDRFYGT